MSPAELDPLLVADGGDTIVPLYIQPRASRTRLVGVHDGMLKLALAAPPVDGKANKALLKFLAKSLGCSTADLTLVAGRTSRRKRVRVRGLSAPEVSLALSGV